ncbi:hypothetical protein T439DRAFT_378304 [Meredithblackwellia eburnea MCA 4105]
MRDPSLDSLSIASFQQAFSNSPVFTQAHLDHFERLQHALNDTFLTLPLEARQLLLRRAEASTDLSRPENHPYYPTAPDPTPTPPMEPIAVRRPFAPPVQRPPASDRSQSSSGSSSSSSASSSRQQPPLAVSDVYRTGNYSSTPPPQPLPPLHRVYVLRCASCDTFLSDRGMRAVLLLKPNIVLFSTDAAPTNAGPVWPDRDHDELPAERTCDCLTSSLGCHGCGNVVGYHIVQPCSRCTASVHRHQRSANHHRYVFHHNEVSFKEREYFPGEQGITGARYIPSSRSPAASPRPSSPSTFNQSTPESKPAQDAEMKDGTGGGNTLRVPGGSGSRDRTPSPSGGSRHGSGANDSMALRAGDVLYWHNLVQGGERAMPVDPNTRPKRVIERLGR